MLSYTSLLMLLAGMTPTPTVSPPPAIHYSLPSFQGNFSGRWHHNEALPSPSQAQLPMVLQPTPTPVTTAPVPSPVATPQPVATDNTTQLESLVLQYTNDAREQNGLRPLANNTILQHVAEGHSADMLQNNYFDHTDKSGCSPSCRITNAGYSWQSIGENIHEMSGYTLSTDDTAHKIVNDWLNSPEHRANVLSSTYTQVGIGIAQQGSTVYSTADYGTQR